jgi:hypothetical protein
MSALFFDIQGIIHKEFVPTGQMVNKEYYMKVLSHLVQRILQVLLQFQEIGSLFLLHDNTRPLTAVSISSFGQSKGFQY